MEMVAVVILVVVLAAATLGSVFFLGMRGKWPPVLAAVIWVSRKFINPRALATAGMPGAYAAIVRHRGRTSGRQYETPIGAEPTDDGFVVALPYGDRASWLRNVLAAGSATIVKDGRTYAVERPEVVPMEAARTWFSPSDQRGFRMMHVDQCLRVRKAPAQD